MLIRVHRRDPRLWFEARGALFQFSEDDGEVNGDRGVLDLEGHGFDPASTGAVIATPGLGIHHPDVSNSHLAIVGKSLLVARYAVFGRQHFDYGNGWPQQYLIRVLIAGNQADVGNAEARGRDLHSQFRESPYVPFLAVIAKPLDERALHFRMIEFSHISLLNLAIDVVAIRAVAGVQIVADRHRQLRCG